VNYLALHVRILAAALLVGAAFLVACGGNGAVRPVPPKKAAPPPDVDRLLSPLAVPGMPDLATQVAQARKSISAEASGAKWLPDDLGEPRFVWFGGLAKNLEPVRALCAGLQDEALPHAPATLCAGLTAAIAAAETQGAALSRLPQPLDEQAYVGLKAKIMSLGPSRAVTTGSQTLSPAVVDRLLGAGHGRARTAADIKVWRGQVATRNAALVDVELEAWRILLRYGWAASARHAQANYERQYTQQTWEDAIKKRRARRRDVPWTERTHRSDWPASAADAEGMAMRKIARVIGAEPANAVIAHIRPKGGQYEPLLASRARYRKVVAKGGFTAVPNMQRARRKKTHKGAPALRERLAQEGFDAPPVDPLKPKVLDNMLVQATMEFQIAHLIRPSHKVGRKTQRALRISASDKLARIDAALEAWRKIIPRPDYYVQVNIPDFHVEVHKQGKVLERIRVVVGNAKRERKKGRLVRPNATPIMHASIESVVYRPYWNIPQRILEEDVIGEEVRDEDNDVQVAWLEDKGYDVVKPGSKWQRVRQLPGPKNPLGRVKILFPNPHEVYLHDTPARALFRRPVRAYSHGCMRVGRPLQLAKTLLEQDGQYDGASVRRWLRRDEPETVTLKQAVPIFVEYIPVRVDAKNRTWFLRDVYKQFDVRTAGQ
jgi:murein L,D-transpeptidase YcbB/YkuD